MSGSCGARITLFWGEAFSAGLTGERRLYGMGGYIDEAFWGEAGHLRAVGWGLPRMISNEVWNGLSFGGVFIAEGVGANGVVTRRMVVLVGATVMLIRAFAGASRPGNDGFPGRGAFTLSP